MAALDPSGRLLFQRHNKNVRRQSLDVNTSRKGNYYRNRTRDWLRSEGYEVEVCEVSYRVFTKSAVVFHKRDLWGADLIAVSRDDELIVVQVKANRGHIARGIKELGSAPWPSIVKKWVCWWPPRQQLVQGPEITEVSPGLPESTR